MEKTIRLRELTFGDLEEIFRHQCDPVACQMAAFTVKDPNDRDSFDARWRNLMADETITLRCILCNEGIAGHIASFDRAGNREITYWIGQKYWGKGVATFALRQFLLIEEPPLYARVAADNLGSRRVLEKCEFIEIDQESGFANARQKTIDEVVMRYG